MRESASISSLPIASIGLKIGGNDIIDINGEGPPNDIGDIGDGWKGPGPPAGIWSSIWNGATEKPKPFARSALRATTTKKPHTAITATRARRLLLRTDRLIVYYLNISDYM